jgi:hypothetical protein
MPHKISPVTMTPRYSLAHLFFRLYHHPTLLYGQGHTHERAFEHLLQTQTDVSYLRHPNGSSRWPDFRIYVRGLPPLSVELKTTSALHVHLGQTWPCPESIYLISYQGHRGIYLGKGRHLLPSCHHAAYQRYCGAVHAIPRPAGVQPRILLHTTVPLSLRDQHFQEVIDDLLNVKHRILK